MTMVRYFFYHQDAKVEYSEQVPVVNARVKHLREYMQKKYGDRGVVVEMFNTGCAGMPRIDASQDEDRVPTAVCLKRLPILPEDPDDSRPQRQKMDWWGEKWQNVERDFEARAANVLKIAAVLGPGTGIGPGMRQQIAEKAETKLYNESKSREEYERAVLNFGKEKPKAKKGVPSEYQ